MDSNIIEPVALRPNDIVIAVMGVTGAGKSTFINQVTGQEVGIGHGLVSHTAAVSIYAHRISSDQCAYLVDTPGFDDTSRNDTEVLKEVAFFFSQIYKNNVHLAGIVYLHRITDNRVSGAALKNLSMFKQLCGENAFGHVVLCTSMWGNLEAGSQDIGDKREKELVTTSEFWGTMHKGGSQVVRWLGTKDSAQVVVDKIVEIHRGTGKVMLRIQEELVDENMSLDETGAGREVQREILVAKAELQEEIKLLQSAHQDMIRQSNETLAKELASQQEAFEQRLVEADESQEKLKISLETLMEQKTVEYEKLLATSISEQQQLADALKQKEVEYAQALRQRLQDEESYKEAQTQFDFKIKALRRQIEDQGSAIEQRNKLEAELRAAQELQAELKKQRLEEEYAASMQQQAIEEQVAKKKKKKERMRDGMMIVGVLAGVVSAVAGVATMNPGLIAMGTSMFGGSLA